MEPLRAEIQIIRARCLDTLQSEAPRIANGGMTSKKEGSVMMTTSTAATLAVQEGQRKVERQEQRMFMVVARFLSEC